MKTTILKSFVAIALVSTNIMAGVVALSIRDPQVATSSGAGAIGPQNPSPGINIPSMNTNSVPNGLLPASTSGLSGSALQRRQNSTVSDNAGSLLSNRGEDKNNNYDQNDIQYLNFLLVLEQFLSAFFERGLSRYSQDDFVRAGYPDWVRGRYVQIAEHEKIHKEFFQSAISATGSGYVQPCHYEFTDNDVRAFVDVSAAVETIATSAYVGVLQKFNERAYITIGASILAVEARHSAWINSAVRKLNPWNTAFETPLTPNEVATLLSIFVNFDSCPSENNGLLPGLHAYPRLTLAPRLVPGEEAEISFPYPNNLQQGERLYIAFLIGIETIFAPVEVRTDNNQKDNNKENQKDDHKNDNKDNVYNNGNARYFVQLPRDLAAKGTVYFILVRGSENIRDIRLDDSTIVAGPAIAEFPFDSYGNPISIGW